jgi:hypothetical protein
VRLEVPRLPYWRYQATAPQPKKKSPSSIPLGCPAATARTKHIPPTARNRAIYSLTGIKEPPFQDQIELTNPIALPQNAYFGILSYLPVTEI